VLNPVTVQGETYHNQQLYQKTRNLSLSGRDKSHVAPWFKYCCLLCVQCLLRHWWHSV